MKKSLVFCLALALGFCSFTFTACDDDDDNNQSQEQTDAKQGSVIDLGNSGLTITTSKKYVKGEITASDTDENQVAYYKSDDSLVDFDIYEWAKADGETLASASAEEAAEYDNAKVETTKINGLDVAYYNATEENDGKSYKTVTYIIDNGDEFVEIVFWLDGDNAQAEVDAIINSLAKKAGQSQGNACSLDKGCIALGKSGLSVSSDKKYKEGEITSSDTDENQVGYYKSDETLVDFDVYVWAKADGETLASASAEEAAEYDNAEVKTTKINGLDVAYYNAVEESEGKEYNTVTYIIDNGDEFVEIVFWLDGENAQAEVDAIINSLAKL